MAQSVRQLAICVQGCQGISSNDFCPSLPWIIQLDKCYLLAPMRCDSNFKSVISQHMLWIKFMSTCEVVLRWIPQNTFDDKSTLGQEMARWHQTASHYLSQCWPYSISPYNVTRLQWETVFIFPWYFRWLHGVPVSMYVAWILFNKLYTHGAQTVQWSLKCPVW